MTSKYNYNSKYAFKNSPINAKKFKETYAFGKPKEANIIKKLTEFFKQDITQELDNYARYDASSMTNKYEIKCSTYSINKYDTVVINVNKTFPNSIFVFSFTEELSDEIYFIAYDENKFNNYNSRYIYPRGMSIRNLVYDIPKQDLTKLI